MVELVRFEWVAMTAGEDVHPADKLIYVLGCGAFCIKNVSE